MPPDAAAITGIADAVTHTSPMLGKTRLICVDGPAGSGKTTTAAALLATLSDLGLAVEVLHLDELFEGWAGLTPEPGSRLEARLLDQVLLPLANGREACWQRYDWHAGAFAEWIPLPTCEVLVLEGCGSGALSYAEYRSALVWVEAGREKRLTRGIARDGEQVLPRWLAWMEAEAEHFTANMTRSRADYVLTTD